MKGNRPMKRLIFVTGTDTGVGKTVITAGLLAVFRKKGYMTLAIKPFQTGATRREGILFSPDAMFYRETGLQDEPLEVLNPVALEPPAAPFVASILTYTPIELSKVYQAVAEVLPRYDLVILEGAGGLCVPILKDFFMADLARELGCPVLVVARGSLGTINHTLLTVRYAQTQGVPVLGVIINGLSPGTDQVENLNPWVIKELSGVPLFGVVPFSPSIDVDKRKIGNLVELMEDSLNFNGLEEAIFGKFGDLG
ncbi:MAG: dethiobiotin synthase [Firmicutes bacterium]|nr:dethiobiotin synthase [Bacillota bacterium]